MVVYDDIRHVEVILYYRPGCPYCRALEEILLDILRDPRFAERVSFHKQLYDVTTHYWSPIARIAEEKKAIVVNIGKGKPEIIDARDIADYAHQYFAGTPILEIRLYRNTDTQRRMEKFLFLGFFGAPTREEFEKRVEELKLNLGLLLEIFTA